MLFCPALEFAAMKALRRLNKGKKMQAKAKKYLTLGAVFLVFQIIDKKLNLSSNVANMLPFGIQA